MSEPASISAGIAARYASALFELAGETGATETLAADIATLEAAHAESADLRALIVSPLYGRDEQEAAIGALSSRMGLSTNTANTLRLLAQKRRLFVLPQFLAALRAMIAEAKGEVTAEVAAAAALSPAQAEALADTLSARIGKTVKLKTHVDETLIGGLVVKVGSTMIDTSVKAKLAALQNAMKEVG